MCLQKPDILILGAGFAGSLTALLLNRIGFKVVLVDRQSHPRFAIGESSTPLADLTLATLAQQYDLPRIAPLAHYGSWKQAYPHVGCGPKRGFSYFLHQRNQPFAVDENHSTELILAASANEEVADTHWLRSDVDQFFAEEAVRAGIPFFDRCDLQLVSRSPWHWRGMRDQEELDVHPRFVIDAGGPAGTVARAGGATSALGELKTHSRSLFAHFRGLRRFADSISPHLADHPFPCDDAAVHQLLEEGWMWQLRFDHGVTSAGFVIENLQPQCDAATEWNQLMAAYPTLEEQFCEASIVAPETGLQSTERLQRLWSPNAAEDWALLPSAAGFIDPLHSTGIAHSLFGIERLIATFEQHWQRPTWAAEMAQINAITHREFQLIDRLVAAAFAARRQMHDFSSAAALYFAAATVTEKRRLAGGRPAFLAADDPALTGRLIDLADKILTACREREGLSETFLEDAVREGIAPWNTAGLLDPKIRNMYRSTALPL